MLRFFPGNYRSGRATGHRVRCLVCPACLKREHEGVGSGRQEEWGAWFCPLCRCRRALGLLLANSPSCGSSCLTPCYKYLSAKSPFSFLTKLAAGGPRQSFAGPSLCKGPGSRCVSLLSAVPPAAVGLPESVVLSGDGEGDKRAAGREQAELPLPGQPGCGAEQRGPFPEGSPSEG